MTQYIQRLHRIAGFGSCDLPDQMVRRYQEDINIINKPFHFKGTSDTCVILVHGWTSTPYEMRVLGEQLNAKGFAVDAPLLSGHGTKPKHLENVSWDQWAQDIDKAYKRVKKQYKKVYVGGMSMGGSLALYVAANNADVDGLILMSTPYTMRHEKLGFCIASVVRRFIHYKKKYYPRAWKAQPSITQLISYQRYPISSAFEAFEMIKKSRKDLKKITQPVFLIQPEGDHLITQGSIYDIYKNISSQKKEMRIIKKANHNFMGNGEHSDVFDSVVNFVKEN